VVLAGIGLGIYILSTLSPTLQNEPPLAVGIGSLSSSFTDRRDSYFSDLKAVVGEYLSSTDNKNMTAPRVYKNLNQRTARNK